MFNNGKGEIISSQMYIKWKTDAVSKHYLVRLRKIKNKFHAWKINNKRIIFNQMFEKITRNNIRSQSKMEKCYWKYV